MQGADQSVNLSGMLGQIAETTGQMGDAYKPVLKGATKPRGDMTDPAHLQNLAQWATTHGDAQAASMYMQQARTLQEEQRRARTSEGQFKAAEIMTQIRENEASEGMDPFLRGQTSRELNEQLTDVAKEYNLDATRYVGYQDSVRDEMLGREIRQGNADAMRRANGQRASLERLNQLYTSGDTEALESALVTLEQDGQATLAREYREGLQALKDAERVRDEHARERNEKDNHNRPLTEEEEADAKRFGIKPEAYPSIGAARSKINDQRVAEARAGMSSKSSRVIAAGVLEDMMPQILRELAADASGFDNARFTPGDDGLTDYINDELLGNETIMKEIAAFVSANGVEQGEASASEVRRLVIEHLKSRAGEDGWIENLFDQGGIQTDLRKLSAKSADDYL